MFNATVRRDGSIRYWSVYTQSWQIAYCQSNISTEEWAAHPENERSMFRNLPRVLLSVDDRRDPLCS